MPRRLDFIRFRVGDYEFEVAFMVALELAGRAERSADEDARAAASKIRGAGASRVVKLTSDELTAFGRTIDAWEAEGETVRRLLERLPEAPGRFPSGTRGDKWPIGRGSRGTGSSLRCTSLRGIFA